MREPRRARGTGAAGRCRVSVEQAFELQPNRLRLGSADQRSASVGCLLHDIGSVLVVEAVKYP